ncbi:hypothetical protein DIC66_01825 [Rhodoferax lacus]|uniref:protein O-GlcNAc transferase n=1 Tax=Rhodoferax lacus TaxID=2184758 RepID=A0A3E1RH07_9BURK|nr:glycosyltransferase family 41 protein [Rhodoferax lacus]RFO98649.1 hypothetical protein DIC66_01825 [Rhodoferax lacus]
MDSAQNKTSGTGDAADAFNAANAAFREGQWERALALYRSAIDSDGTLDTAALQCARCLVQLERWMPAREAFAATLRINPANYSAWLEAGHLCRRMGEEQQAMLSYQRAIDQAPQRYEAPLALARTLELAGNWDVAQRAYAHAVQAAAALSPSLAREVHRHMARYRLERGDAERAMQSLQEALILGKGPEGDAVDPEDQADIQIDIGECLIRLGAMEQGLLALTSASNAQRESTLARLAALSLRYNLWQEAIAVSRRNVELHPGSPWAHWNLAYLLNDCWHMEEAEAALRQAEAMAPMPGARALRASMASRRGDADTALALYQEMAREPGADPTLAASIAMTSLYSDKLSAADVAALHRRLFAPLGAGARSKASFVREPIAGRRIRLGLVSADFHHQHPVNLFMQPVLRELDRSRFELFVYFTGTSYDAQTRFARDRSEHWVEVSTLNCEQLAKRIDRDGVDVLLDLAGHTDAQRTLLYARRAAPVQATYLGYPGSTGLPNMDWIVGDAVVTPEGDEALFSERVVRLPGAVFCYAPEAHYPYPPYGPSHGQRPLTFGSFNNVPKLTEHTLRLWAQVLAAVPGSRLLLKAPSMGDASAVAAFGKRLEGLGVDLARVEFRGPIALTEMMAEYADVDIALDPVPYNGGTTTLQALWMGVPVITKRGSSFVSRMGASFMTAAGLPEWVADDDADYVRIAVQQASNRKALLTLKKGLRKRLQGRPAWDVVQHTRNLEAAIEQMCAESDQSSSLAAMSGNKTSV